MPTVISALGELTLFRFFLSALVMLALYVQIKRGEIVVHTLLAPKSATSNFWDDRSGKGNNIQS